MTNGLRSAVDQEFKQGLSHHVAVENCCAALFFVNFQLFDHQTSLSLKARGAFVEIFKFEPRLSSIDFSMHFILSVHV